MLLAVALANLAVCRTLGPALSEPSTERDDIHLSENVFFMGPGSNVKNEVKTAIYAAILCEHPQFESIKTSRLERNSNEIICGLLSASLTHRMLSEIYVL